MDSALQAYLPCDLKILRAKTGSRSCGDGEEQCSSSKHVDENKEGGKFQSYFSPQIVHPLKKTDMEKFQSHLSSIAQRLNKVSTLTAPNPILLSSPPKDLDKKEKIYLHPKEAFTDIKYSMNTLHTHVAFKKLEEPKFVPYEPYKACVKPIVGTKKYSKVKQSLAIQSQPKFLSSIENVNEIGSCEVKEDKEKINAMVIDFEKERSQWEIRNGTLKKENEDLERKISQVLKESLEMKQSFQSQISVQSQVNSELKKLLVASVGEDVQGRVQNLTEDKARMASMIRSYSEKVDRDYEERERINIDCDVWRSKFMASSFLVNELAQWKGMLIQHLESAREALRVLLEERNVAHHHLTESCRYLNHIHSAFDPLHSECGGFDNLHSSDIVSLSLSITQIGEKLRDRLLGTLGRSLGSGKMKFPSETFTPGEKMAMQVLEHCLDYNAKTTFKLNSQMIVPFNPHAKFERLDLNCCGKCNGEIKVV